MADEDVCPPSRVWTANFSASALDFMMEAATCICVLPALAARRLLTIAIISIRNTPVLAGKLPGRG